MGRANGSLIFVLIYIFMHINEEIILFCLKKKVQLNFADLFILFLLFKYFKLKITRI